MHVPDDLTFGFDAQYYKSRHADLEAMSDEEALNHYIRYGHLEGRIQSCVAAREVLLPQIPNDAPVLEIGPFGAPQVIGGHVRYADFLSTEELRRRAPEHGYAPEKCPEIHYVLRNESLGDIGERFSAVFSSHCIEHQTDLVKHLQEVAGILEPGGRYFLIVPDKRYCFDHFITETDVSEVLAAHAEKRSLHSLRAVIAAHTLSTHNDPIRHWAGDHGEPAMNPAGISRVHIAVEAYANSVERNEYLDVHEWQFTPRSFQAISTQLFNLGLVGLRLTAISAPLRGRPEFCAILTKTLANGK